MNRYRRIFRFSVTCLLVSTAVLIRLLELSSTKFSLSRQTVGAGEIWRLLSYSLFHNGSTHLLYDVLGVSIIGAILEWRLTKWSYGALLCLSTLGSATGFLLTQPFDATVGLSGVYHGLIGCLIGISLAQHRFLAFSLLGFFSIKSLCEAFGLSSAELFTTSFGHAIKGAGAYGAHAGGLMMGLFFSHYLQKKNREKRTKLGVKFIGKYHRGRVGRLLEDTARE